MQIQDTLKPYATIEHKGIQYSTCREFDHISRYRCLRQVIHSPKDSDRLLALETCNPIEYNCNVMYHVVRHQEVNRLDIISKKHYGSAKYSWVIAYFNNIADGYTVSLDEVLVMPTNITDLFAKGELLAPVPAITLNLGYE